MYPKVNQNIIIDLLNEEQTFRSIVAEVGENEILIGLPLDGNHVGLFPDGTELELTYITDENKYCFQTEIIGRKVDNISLYRLRKPREAEIIRIQQRENFRVSASLPLILNHQTELYTLNVSAGGLLFSSGLDLPLEEGQIIKGDLKIPNNPSKESHSVPFDGEIIRVTVDQDRKSAAVKFVGIDQRDQMKVIQYCFEKQRQNRLNR